MTSESIRSAKEAAETLAEQAKQILDPPSMRRKFDAMVRGVRFVVANYQTLDDVFAQVDAHARSGDFELRLRNVGDAIMARWPEWEQYAGQAAQQAQTDDAWLREMHEQLDPVIKDFVEAELHEALRHQAARTALVGDLVEALTDAVTSLGSCLTSIDEKAWPNTTKCIGERIERYKAILASTSRFQPLYTSPTT